MKSFARRRGEASELANCLPPFVTNLDHTAWLTHFFLKPYGRRTFSSGKQSDREINILFFSLLVCVCTVKPASFPGLNPQVSPCRNTAITLGLGEVYNLAPFGFLKQKAASHLAMWAEVK